MSRARPAVLLVALSMATACGPDLISSGGSGPDEAADAGPTGGGGGGGGGYPGDETTCDEDVSIQLDVVAYPPDVLVILDRSSSMGYPMDPSDYFTLKWTVVTGALKDLVTTFADRIDFGLAYSPHPGDASCAAGIIDIAPATGTSHQITNSLDDINNQPGGSSPTSSSLSNARDYFRNHPKNPYGRYVILAADGKPNCFQNEDQATIDAARALKADGVPVYVLGVKTDSDVDLMNKIAAAGGTGSYYKANSATEIADQLNGITSSVEEISCDMTLEKAPTDPTEIIITVDGNKLERSTDHSQGWDYDPDTHTLTFYGDACDNLKTSPQSVVHAEYCAVVD